jgi:hypothetical protein
MSGLNGSLLVGADHVFLIPKRHTLPPSFVEIQDPRGLIREVGSPREDSGAMVEGADGIFGEPPPDGAPRDMPHDAPSDHLPGYLLGAPAAQGHARGGRKLTGDGLHLHPHFGGKSSGACPNEVDLAVPLNPPGGIACATSRAPEGWCPVGGLSPCWRPPRRPKERSWRESPPSRHRCESVPASAGRRAPLRKARCEKGPGWACALLSRRDDLRRETLPWCREGNTSTKFSQRPLRDAQFPIKGYEAFELGERPRLCSRSGQSLP